MEDSFISAAINYLSDAIEEAGYFMMVKKATDIMEIVKFASMWNLDGLVVLSFCSDEYQQLRNEIRIPFVVYDGFFENKGRICNLVIDDYDGGRQIPMKKEQRDQWYKIHLDQLKNCSAIFAVSDYYAVDLMQFLQAHDVKIPREISIAGFDGTPICQQVAPTLTSVSQDSRKRAFMTVEQLQRMREDPEYREDFVFPVELVPERTFIWNGLRD